MATRSEFDAFRQSYQRYFPGLKAYLSKFSDEDRGHLFDGWYTSLQPFTLEDLNQVVQDMLAGETECIPSNKYPEWGLEILQRVRLVRRRAREVEARNRDRENQAKAHEERVRADSQRVQIYAGFLAVARARKFANEKGWSDHQWKTLCDAIATLTTGPPPILKRDAELVLQEYGVADMLEQWTAPLKPGEKVFLFGSIDDEE